MVKAAGLDEEDVIYDRIPPEGEVATLLCANRQRIVKSGGCLFRHRIASRNVRGNRQQPRG
jgi:hypothetical protein